MANQIIFAEVHALNAACLVDHSRQQKWMALELAIVVVGLSTQFKRQVTVLVMVGHVVPPEWVDVMLAVVDCMVPLKTNALMLEVELVTTCDDAFATSSSRPCGTTRNDGFNVGSGRPCGTTRVAGCNASSGRPRGTTRDNGLTGIIQYMLHLSFHSNWDNSDDLVNVSNVLLDKCSWNCTTAYF